MNVNALTARLASEVMGWRVAPDRFLLGERRWKPRHYFQPTKRPADALQLLKAAAVESYSIQRNACCEYSVTVRIAGRRGEAQDKSEALAISLAVARALDIDVDLRGDRWKD